MADAQEKTDTAQAEAAAPQGYQHLHVDGAVERRVVRKTDLNLMPLVIALCPSPRSSGTSPGLTNDVQTCCPFSIVPISATPRRPGSRLACTRLLRSTSGS